MQNQIAELLIEEYKLLKGESLHYSTVEYTTINLSIAAITVLVNILIKNRENLTIVYVISAIVIPIVSIISLFMWFGSVERIARIANYLRKKELDICHEVDKNKKVIIGWENYIAAFRSKLTKRRKFNDYYAIIILYYLIIIFGLVYGNIRLIDFVTSSLVNLREIAKILISVLYSITSIGLSAFYFYKKGIHICSYDNINHGVQICKIEDYFRIKT